jgi:hypothetical protein
MVSLQNKKILFFAGVSGRDTLMNAVDKEIQQRYNVKTHYVAHMRQNYDFLIRSGVSKDNITPIYTKRNIRHTKPDMKYLRKCEEKYGFKIWDIWSVSSCRTKQRMTMKNRKVLSQIEYVIRTYEKVLDDFKPNYYIYAGLACYSTLVCCYIAHKKNIKVMEFQQALLPNRFAISDDAENNWPILIKEYAKLKKRKLTPAELRQAKGFLKKYQNRPSKPDSARKFEEPLLIRFRKVTTFVKNSIKYRQIPSMMTLGPVIIWPIRGKLIDRLNIYNKPRIGKEKYVLFPLQFQPEASTLIHGKWNINQLELIRKISRSLPVDYKLYVKEHTYRYSNKELDMYKQIKLLPNTRLLSPYEKTFDLMRNSEMVITNTGTTAFEAALLEKPSIHFGNTAFAVFEGAKKVKDLSQLPNIFQRELNSRIDEHNLLKFISSLFKSTYPGLGRLPADCKNKSLAPQNISRLVDGIEKYIKAL